MTGAQRFKYTCMGGTMKQPDHKRITGKAIDLFVRYDNTGGKNLLEHKDSLIEGTVIEDTKPLIERISNWHFYNRADNLQPIEMKWKSNFDYGGLSDYESDFEISDALKGTSYTLRPTSEHILGKRIVALEHELAQNSSKGKIFKAAGKVLHHIQDMSTPSHVVPVYHDPFYKDPFEKFFTEELDCMLAMVSVSKEEFNSIDNKNISCTYAYKEAAKATLDYLDNKTFKISVLKNGKAVTKTVGTSCFWERPGIPPGDCSRKGRKMKMGFGRFGLLGKNFGEERVKRCKTTYFIESKVYYDLCLEIVKKTLMDSLHFLKILPEILKKVQKSRA